MVLLARHVYVLPTHSPPPWSPLQREGTCPLRILFSVQLDFFFICGKRERGLLCGTDPVPCAPLKALYENMLVELPFAGFFLSKLLGTSADVDIHHLASLDPEVYKNLLFLKSYDGDVEELGLNFTVVNNDLGEAQVRRPSPCVTDAGPCPRGDGQGLLLWGDASRFGGRIAMAEG